MNDAKAEAEQNRALFPQVTAWVDELRKHFGEVKVKYAKEGGNERGIPPR